MTTITALNVRLGMDVSNFSEGANLAKSEVTKVASIMRQSVPPAEKYKQELDLLNRAFSDAGKKSAEYANALDHLEKKHQQGKYSADELQKSQKLLNDVIDATAAATKRQKEETARLLEAEKQRQSILNRGKQLSESLLTAEEQHVRRLREYGELRRSGAISENTYNRAVESSKRTLAASQATSEAAVAVTKRLKDEKLRLAEAERQAQAVTDRGRALTQSVEKAQESHNRRVREYTELRKSGAISEETFRRAVERSNKTLKESQSSGNGMLASIKGLAAAYLTFQTVTKSIGLANEIEDATIAFEVLTGSARNGAILFEQIRRLDRETPITFSNATQAAKTMLSFGVAVEDIAGNLRMLSDVTGGNNERFKMLSLAFAQMSSAGRLMGQDLLQMVNAGFNPLQQISKTTGESLIELKKRMEDGGISTEEVRQAFIDATAEGGMFHGMTERLAETLSGKLNIALSDYEKKLAAAGEAMKPFVSQVLDSSGVVNFALDSVIETLRRISEGLGFALALLTDLLNSIATFSIDTTAMNKFLDDLEKRDRDIAQAKEAATQHEFEQKHAAVNEVAIAERKAAKEAAEAKQKAIEEQKKAMEAAAEEEKKRIEDAEEARLKAIENEKKEREKAKQQAEEQFQRDLETARKGAMDYFQQQEEKNKQRRADVAAGPGAGMEVGSAEAAKFAADRVNRQIGVAAVPEQPSPGEAEIAKKAEQLYKEQKIANTKADAQTVLLTSLVTQSKENGFRRIR